jgi:hypothetical protein
MLPHLGISTHQTCQKKFNSRLVVPTIYGMGGHPVLSFAPDILLAADSNSLGTAIDEFEICDHVEPAHGPVSGSDFLMTRFRERLPTLPKSFG